MKVKHLKAKLIPFIALIFLSSSTISETQTSTIKPEHTETYTITSKPTPTPSTVRSAPTSPLKQISAHGVKVSSNSELLRPSVSQINKCARTVLKTLKSLPKEHVSNLKTLILTFDTAARRGLGGGDKIILRCTNVTDTELSQVLIHEMGHIVDSSYLTGNSSSYDLDFKDGQSNISSNDPSLDFYKISFTSESELISEYNETDFVSGYASSDPFEDFAETYNFYVSHPDLFLNFAKSNLLIQQKYNFMRDNVFSGKEFTKNNRTFNTSTAEIRDYDSTLLSSL